MTTNVPKWVPVTAAIALASLVLTLVLGFNVDRQRRDEERRDCERAVLFRADSRAMWVYVIGLSGPERTPEEQDRFDAFVAEPRQAPPGTEVRGRRPGSCRAEPLGPPLTKGDRCGKPVEGAWALSPQVRRWTHAPLCPFVSCKTSREAAMPRLPLIFYNIGPAGDRDAPDLAARREVKALLHDKPAVLGLSEAIGWNLPQVPGYRLTRNLGRPGRANIAAYVRTDLKVPQWRIRWHDMRQTWGRTEHDGEHPPRSWLEMYIEGVQVIVGHQPPKFTDNVELSQQEGINLLRTRMSPWTRPTWAGVVGKKHELARPRVVLADFNRGPHEDGPGPKALAERIGGEVVGDRIDAAVVRNGKPVGVCYVGQPAGVRLGSDHPEAFSFTLVTA